MTRDDPLSLYKAEKELQMEREAVKLHHSTPKGCLMTCPICYPIKNDKDLRRLALMMAEHLEHHEIENYREWCEANGRDVDQFRKNLEHIYAVAMVFIIELQILESEKQ